MGWAESGNGTEAASAAAACEQLPVALPSLFSDTELLAIQVDSNVRDSTSRRCTVYERSDDTHLSCIQYLPGGLM